MNAADASVRKNDALRDGPSSWWAALVASAPFVIHPFPWAFIAGLVALASAARLPIPDVGDPALWRVRGYVLLAGASLYVTLLTLGWVKRFPVWCYPSDYRRGQRPTGVFVAIYRTVSSRIHLSDCLFRDLNRFFMSLFPPYLSGYLYSILNSGSLWLSLLAVLIVMVLATAALPPLRPLYQRLRRDRTLLSFIVYGASPIALTGFIKDTCKNV